MQWADQSLNGTCVASCSSLSFCVGLFLGPALAPIRQFCLLPHLTFHLVPFPIFRFLLFHLCTMLPALQACRKRFDHSLSLPAENWTCFIKTNPHVHCVHSVVHVQLHHCSVSNVSNVRILFIHHDNVSGLDTSCIEMRGLPNTRTSGCYAPLNSLVYRECNVLFTQVSDLFPIRCHKLLR